MSDKVDILVIGATGFTGRLVAKYLSTHRELSSFTFALAARSPSKLAALVAELNLSSHIPLLTLDVTKEDNVEDMVKIARVVINTVGPYLLWGTPVLRACARNGIHYVDITGETIWIKNMIDRFDYQAFKTHAVIVPSCGYDSLPSDLSAYLSVQALKLRLGSDVEAARSVSAHDLKMGVSGGTLRSMYTYLTENTRQKLIESSQDHWISPVAGVASPPTRLIYSLPACHIPSIVGGFSAMSATNRSIVLRTRGLLEANPLMRSVSYGPAFSYEEFLVTRNRISGALVSLGIWSIMFCLGMSRAARWLFKRLIVDRVYGPSDRAMEEAFGTITTVTSSVPTLTYPETWATTVFRIRGDPGYLCTSVMLSECAIALLDTSKLTPLAREGGVLTPASAFGDELRKRLVDSDRFHIETYLSD